MVRLAPKVSVAVTTVMASTAPARTERTGTAVRPRPGSRASRRPSTPGDGSPAATAARPAAGVRSRAWSRAAARCGTWR